MENALVQYSLSSQENDFEVQFEALPVIDVSDVSDSRKKEIMESVASIDKQQSFISQRINELNTDIDRLTNNADGFDYMVAVSCGVICGLIDSFFVGELDFDEAFKKTNEKINQYVEEKAEEIRTSETVQRAIESAKKKAAKVGKKLSKQDIDRIKKEVTEGVANKFKEYIDEDAKNGTANALRRSIVKLEEHYKLASDNAHKGLKGMNSASHHLDDLAHHPTFLGFIAAIIGEVFRAGVLVDKNGHWHIKWLGFDKSDLKRWLELVIPIIISGIITWLLNVVNSKYKEEVDKKLPAPIRKITSALAQAPLAIAILKSIRNVFTNWWGHLVSDMAGSKTSPGAGMGIPGLFVSILKELSSIPPLNYTGLPKLVDEIYTQNRFDLRKELALLNELGRQSIPIIIGDVLVRTFYFVKHLITELSNKKDYKDVNWRNVIPINNRTIARMMTIETGTFTAIDIADAAIRSAISNGGNVYNPKLYTDFVLRVNFVGIGRFAIAVTSDIAMGMNRNLLIKEKIFLRNKYLMLEEAKLYYYQKETWIEAKEAAIAIQHLYEVACKALVLYHQKILELDKEWGLLSNHVENIKANDPAFAEELIELIDL